MDPLVRVNDPVTEFSRPIPADFDKRVEGDSIRIGGDWCPGLAIARKGGTPRKWDKRPGYGFSGATLVYLGLDLSEFQVDVSIWTQRQMTSFLAFYRKYLQEIQAPRAVVGVGATFLPALQPKALGIYNPFLAAIGILSVEITNVSQFELVDERGIYGCTIDMIVYRPAVQVLARPAGQIPNAGKPIPTAKSKGEEEIQRLLDQAQHLEDNLANGGAP